MAVLNISLGLLLNLFFLQPSRSMSINRYVGPKLLRACHRKIYIKIVKEKQNHNLELLLFNL